MTSGYIFDIIYGVIKLKEVLCYMHAQANTHEFRPNPLSSDNCSVTVTPDESFSWCSIVEFIGSFNTETEYRVNFEVPKEQFSNELHDSLLKYVNKLGNVSSFEVCGPYGNSNMIDIYIGFDNYAKRTILIDTFLEQNNDVNGERHEFIWSKGLELQFFGINNQGYFVAFTIGSNDYSQQMYYKLVKYAHLIGSIAYTCCKTNEFVRIDFIFDCLTKRDYLINSFFEQNDRAKEKNPILSFKANLTLTGSSEDKNGYTVTLAISNKLFTLEKRYQLIKYLRQFGIVVEFLYYCIDPDANLTKIVIVFERISDMFRFARCFR